MGGSARAHPCLVDEPLDLVVDGASMVSNYKAQFDHIIRDGSYAGLLERMRQRNLIAKLFERTVPAVPMSSILTAPQ